VSCRLKEVADASMQAAESLTSPQAATKIMAGMAEWREWRTNGRMAEMATYVLFTVHTDIDTDTDTDDDDDTL
jgi:hypothetical protein